MLLVLPPYLARRHPLLATSKENPLQCPKAGTVLPGSLSSGPLASRCGEDPYGLGQPSSEPQAGAKDSQCSGKPLGPRRVTGWTQNPGGLTCCPPPCSASGLALWPGSLHHRVSAEETVQWGPSGLTPETYVNIVQLCISLSQVEAPAGCEQGQLLCL